MDYNSRFHIVLNIVVICPWQLKSLLNKFIKVLNELVRQNIFMFILCSDRVVRTGGKHDQELVDQSVHDKSQISCFFSACDREASEKLLQDSYNHSKLLLHVVVCCSYVVRLLR
jgi:hypothetical protein